MRTLSVLVLLPAVAALLSLAHARSGFYSAMCIIFQERCPPGMQTESDGCQAVSTLEQAMECLASACSHCNHERSDQFPCLNPEITKICEGGEVRPTVLISTLSQMMAVMPTPTPQMMPTEPTPTPQMMPTEPTPTPQMMPMDPTPTPQMMPMDPTPTPQMMPMEPSPTPMMMSMEPEATPVVPLPMDGSEMGMGTMGDMPVMTDEVMSSEEPVEPSPEMSMETSPTPEEMPTATPEYTPMSGGRAMMMDETTMPPTTEAMTEPPTTMPPPMTEAVTEPPTTMPPMTEPMTEPPTTMPPMTGSRCTYSGTNRVTISLGSVTAGDGWVPKTRAGLSGLVFRPDKNHGILRPGVEGEMCFSVRLSEPGDYHLTAVSAAPHHTENNDMWIKSSKPLTLIRKGVARNGNTDWYKGYQNNGGNRIADHLKTVDNRGHDFVVTNVRANEMFNICVSGRSYRYEVFKIILNKCDSATCLSGVSPRGTLINSTPSSCA